MGVMLGKSEDELVSFDREVPDDTLLDFAGFKDLVQPQGYGWVSSEKAFASVKIRTKFYEVDDAMTGTIDHQQLVRALRELGMHDNEIRDACACIPKNSKVSFSTFKQLAMEPVSPSYS